MAGISDLPNTNAARAIAEGAHDACPGSWCVTIVCAECGEMLTNPKPYGDVLKGVCMAHGRGSVGVLMHRRDCLLPRATDNEVERQRLLGWEEGHPEAFCDHCGRPNIAWYTDNDSWNRATGNVGILCPVCFVARWEAQTGVPSCWELRPTASTLSRLVASPRSVSLGENPE